MFRKYKLVIPALVLVTLSAWTFINSGVDYSLTVQHYCGLAAALLCTISFFTFKRYYGYILGVTLLLGLIHLLNFTPAQTTTSLGFNTLSISFQPYSLFVIILTVVLAIPKKSKVTLVEPKNASMLGQAQFKEELERFRKLYNTKSSADLTEILNDTRFTPAAKEAANQLVSEKQSEKEDSANKTGDGATHNV